jgi:alkanesulfonate monooxygenase SsuD/methylene tetrahydromethanopterin reductase-like flavin-dependent oxidoreductase (luciferase family)
MTIGFGVAGALDHAIIAELARAVEKAGFSSFWANDTPNGDGLAALAVAQKQTSSIKLGVGVIPIDRKPAADIAAQIDDLDLDPARLIVGIGSGGMKIGAIESVRGNALELRRLTPATVVIGALGPRMCEVGGESADGVLLNWLTPAYSQESAAHIRAVAAAAGRPDPYVGAYVRVALDGPGAERVRGEAARYEGYPAYAAHFNRMGVRALDTCVVGTRNQIADGLRAFSGSAREVIVRAIAADESLDAYLALLVAAAPTSIETE